MSRADNVQEISGAIGHSEQNGGRDKSRGARVFCVVIQTVQERCSRQRNGNFAMADFHQIWPRNVVRCSVDDSGKTLSNIFTLGVICPKNLKSKVGQIGSGTSLRAGYKSRDALQRDTVYSTSQGVSETGSPYLYDVRTIRLRSDGASKLPNFRILAYFHHTKTPTSLQTPTWTSL